MKNITIILFIVFSSSLFAQDVNTYVKTGDAEIDFHLDQINDYGRAEYEFFKKDMSLKFGVSTGLVDDYYYKQKISPANMYMGFVLNGVTDKPIADIFALYKERKGWGELAKELGIKPGSREFHMMKGKALSGIGKVKSKHFESRKGGMQKGTKKGKR